LASPSNITQVLSELKEYATEVDVDFVRKAVRAIGRCAIKIESQAQRCVDTLVDLIETKVNYVVQEAGDVDTPCSIIWCGVSGVASRSECHLA
jgi:AP-1 complex subunit beta-1